MRAHAAMSFMMIAIGAQAAAQPPDLDARAMARLDRMGVHLRSLQSFQVQAVTRDSVIVYQVSRPDRLRLTRTGSTGEFEVVYDSRQIGMILPKERVYAVEAAPADIEAALDHAARGGWIAPLSDLFYWGGANARLNELKSARFAGASAIAGYPCDRLVFSETSVDWEVCVGQGETPLPYRLTISERGEAAERFSADLTWEVRRFTPETFVFRPPSDMTRAEFGVVAAQIQGEVESLRRTRF